MISFDRGGVRFHYRVAGVCVHDGYILLHRADHDDYWALPDVILHPAFLRTALPEIPAATPHIVQRDP